MASIVQRCVVSTYCRLPSLRHPDSDSVSRHDCHPIMEATTPRSDPGSPPSAGQTSSVPLARWQEVSMQILEWFDTNESPLAAMTDALGQSEAGGVNILKLHDVFEMMLGPVNDRDLSARQLTSLFMTIRWVWSPSECICFDCLCCRLKPMMADFDPPKNSEFLTHPLCLATPWQGEAMWKGCPLKSDIRTVLVKVLQIGLQTTGVWPLSLV